MELSHINEVRGDCNPLAYTFEPHDTNVGRRGCFNFSIMNKFSAKDRCNAHKKLPCNWFAYRRQTDWAKVTQEMVDLMNEEPGRRALDVYTDRDQEDDQYEDQYPDQDQALGCDIIQSIEIDQGGIDGEVLYEKSRKRRRLQREATPDASGAESAHESIGVAGEEVAETNREHDQSSNGAGEDNEEEGEEEGFYEVEKVIRCQYHRGWQYRVKWLGYPNSKNTWEPWQNVRGSLDLVKDFHERNPKVRGPLEWKELDLRPPPRL